MAIGNGSSAVLRWSEIPFHPTDRQLRRFGLLLTAFLMALAVWEGWTRSGLAAGVLSVLGTMAGGLALGRPGWLRPIFVGWMVAAFPVGWLVSRLMIALIFYGVFTPIGLVMRAFGRDALERRWRPELSSYWSPKARSSSPRSYFRQF